MLADSLGRNTTLQVLNLSCMLKSVRSEAPPRRPTQLGSHIGHTCLAQAPVDTIFGQLVGKAIPLSFQQPAAVKLHMFYFTTDLLSSCCFVRAVFWGGGQDETPKLSTRCCHAQHDRGQHRKLPPSLARQSFRPTHRRGHTAKNFAPPPPPQPTISGPLERGSWPRAWPGTPP